MDIPADVLLQIFKHFDAVSAISGAGMQSRLSVDVATSSNADRAEKLKQTVQDQSSRWTLLQLTLSCRKWSSVSVQLLWKSPNFSKIDIATQMGFIQYWNKQTFGRVISFHQECSLYNAIQPVRPQYDYASMVRSISLQQINAQIGDSGVVMHSYRLVPASIIFKWLPHCLNLQVLDLGGIGRTPLCQSALNNQVGIEECYCSTSCLLYYLSNIKARSRLHLLNLQQWNGKGYGDQCAKALSRVLSNTNQKPVQCALKSLDLSESYVISDTYAENLAYLWQNLESIKLSSMPFVTAKFMENVLPLGGQLKSVKELDMSYCPSLGPEALKIIGTRMPNLQSLNISNCPQFQSKDLEDSIFCGHEPCVCVGSRLKSLKMSLLPVTDTLLQKVAQCAKQLQVLKLTGCTLISYDAVISLIEKLGQTYDAAKNQSENRKLQYLDVSYCTGVLTANVVDQDEAELMSPNVLVIGENDDRWRQDLHSNLLIKHRSKGESWMSQNCELYAENIQQVVQELLQE
ncbi:hypothetical protein MP228_008429 [Amoeboaphelidium protococcarum]|nr:hypothetical protein MP228_008429 [Amoeboaphelidium protococcarum]